MNFGGTMPASLARWHRECRSWLLWVTTKCLGDLLPTTLANTSVAILDRRPWQVHKNFSSIFSILPTGQPTRDMTIATIASILDPSRCSRSIPPTAGVRTEPTTPTTPSTMPTHLTFLTTAPAHSSTRGLKRNSPPPKNVGRSHSCSFTTRHSRPGRMDCLPARKKTATVNRANRCVCSPSSFPRMACELFSLGTTRCTSTPL